MKLNKSLFSFSASDVDYFNDKQDKFVLAGCPIIGKYCKGKLPSINKDYLQSEQSLRNKEFNRAIDSLKSAYATASELKESPCTKCSLFFRSTITESLGNIQKELEKKSFGIFSTKRHQESYLRTGLILEEIKV